MQLSENFSTDELKCDHCGRCNVTPELVSALQSLRDLARLPIQVTSGYRCPEHNRAVGGASASQHAEGKAADIKITGLNVLEMYLLVCEVPAFRNGGVGLYDGGFIHVDVRRGRARWARVGGKYGPIEDILGSVWKEANQSQS